MAFISKVHNFSGDFQAPATILPMWYDDTAASSQFLDNYDEILMSQEYYITTKFSRSSSSWKTSLPENFRVSDHMLVPSPTTPTGFSSIPDGIDFQNVEKDENFSSSCGYPTNSLETESQKTSKEVEEPTIKIGKYSTEERKDKIMRYLKKRNQRNFNKTIKYECRKTLADKRVRVRGRFAKNNNDHHQQQQLCADQVLPIITNANTSLDEDLQHLYFNNFPMKQDYDEEEEWLQEAMASLLYSPLTN